MYSDTHLTYTYTCGWVSDKNIFTWSISGNKITFSGLITLAESIKLYRYFTHVDFIKSITT